VINLIDDNEEEDVWHVLNEIERHIGVKSDKAKVKVQEQKKP
jgi:hypothetical protein